VCARLIRAGTSPCLGIVRAAMFNHERQLVLVCPAHHEPCKRCCTLHECYVGVTMLRADMHSRCQCVGCPRREGMQGTGARVKALQWPPQTTAGVCSAARRQRPSTAFIHFLCFVCLYMAHSCMFCGLRCVPASRILFT